MRIFVLISVTLLLIANVKGFDLKCSTSIRFKANSCVVSSLQVTDPNQFVTSINGQNEFYYGSQSIKMISIEGQTVNFMPRGIEKFFPNLEIIRIYQSQLKSIGQKDLKPFRKLKELDLMKNDIEFLEGDLFEFNLDLEQVNFVGNKLIYVEENILKPLTKLRFANFQNNKCLNGYVYSDVSRMISELKRSCSVPTFYLQLKAKIKALEKNNLNGIFDAATKNLFVTSKRLKLCEATSGASFIDRHTTEIHFVQCDIVNGDDCRVENFKVEFAGSKIGEVRNRDGQAIDGHEITNISFTGQQMLFLPSNLVEHFANVKEFVVTSSGLFEISSKDFKNLSTLIYLNLTKNKLYEIPSEAFKDLRSLLKLDLSSNKIENLQNRAFEGLNSLQQLNLNDNRLVIVTGDLFEDLNSLRVLFLNMNKLMFINANLLSPMSQLELVDLTSNDCINMSYPENTLQQIEQKVIESCIAPIEMKCLFENEAIFVSESLNVSSFLCKTQGLDIDAPKAKIAKVNGISIDDQGIADVTDFLAINQSMKFFPFQFAKILPKLEVIIIERSKLMRMQNDDLDGFKMLKAVMIRHNNLKSIEAGTFDKVIQLEVLDLSSNHIHSLPAELFSKLVQLKTLDLSNNRIEQLSANLLPPRNVIEEFSAVNNQLSFIETQVVRYLGKSKFIDLRRNVCIDLNYKAANNTVQIKDFFFEVNFNCFYHGRRR